MAATNGHDGTSVSITPPNALNGDPGIGISSFPAEANVRDVDADPSATRITTLTTGGGDEATLFGV
jgi:hypothetical protein